MPTNNIFIYLSYIVRKFNKLYEAHYLLTELNVLIGTLDYLQNTLNSDKLIQVPQRNNHKLFTINVFHTNI